MMLVIVLESWVISVVVQVISCFEFMCCSICFGLICRLRKGRYFWSWRILCVRVWLKLGSMVIKLLSDVVSMLSSVVSIISIVVIIRVMVNGCCIFW